VTGSAPTRRTSPSGIALPIGWGGPATGPAQASASPVARNDRSVLGVTTASLAKNTTTAWKPADLSEVNQFERNAQEHATIVQWFADSFYGQTARLDPQPAYYAPPLDGIWATAPYLHNGSVPSLATLLDSSKRPAYWQRRVTDGQGNDFDETELGWQYDAVAAPASKSTRVYDTTQPGYGNAGHTYGDALSADDRTALLEYLKTL